MLQKLDVIVGQTGNNYSAYIEGLDGIVATGATLEEIRSNMIEAIDLYIETCKEEGLDIPKPLQGDYSLEYRVDVQNLLNMFSGIFTKSGLERLTGINQKQLWHYANGKSHPRRAQVLKIENALHRLGNELISLRL